MSNEFAFTDTSEKLSTTLEKLIGKLQGQTITLRELMEAIGEQGLLLICAIASLPFLIPVSIPGVSTVFGAAIILVSLAITLNRLPWLPAKILDRQMETAKLVPALQKGVAIVSRLDRFIRPRIPALTTGVIANRINGLALRASDDAARLHSLFQHPAGHCDPAFLSGHDPAGRRHGAGRLPLSGADDDLFRCTRLCRLLGRPGHQQLHRGVAGLLSVPVAGLPPVPPRCPPDHQPSPLATNSRQVVGKHDKADGNHPETQNGQKAQRPAHDQRRTRCDPADARTRHGKAPFSEIETTRSMVDSEFHSNPPFSIWPVDNFFSVDKPGKSGLRRDKTRGMRFF